MDHAGSIPTNPLITDALTADSLVEAKITLRQQVLARRDALTSEDRSERSAELCQQLSHQLETHFAWQPNTPAYASAERHPMTSQSTSATTASSATTSAIAAPAPAATQAAPPVPTTVPSTPLVALYSAMKSEVDLALLAQWLREKSWQACYPLMLKPEANAAKATSGLPGNPASCSPEASASASPCQMQTPPKPEHSMAFYIPPHTIEGITPIGLDILTHPLRRHSPHELTAAGFTFVNPSAIDAMIVPLVAFDAANHRLGYGGGNYDNFLPLLRDDCLVMGVAFKEQRVSSIPLEPHDLPLPKIFVG